MRFGYWMPVFGGWLRNIPDEGMEASWDYVKRLTQRSEETGWDLTLIAELNLNDIKGVDQPALDAWSTAAALAAVTSSIELMVAVRPNFHQPALFAKAAANIDNISGGRLALNVVSSWWADEATQYGLQFDQHDDRYARTTEWLQVVDGLWTRIASASTASATSSTNAICEPKPVQKAAADDLRRRRERSGQDDDRDAVRRLCDARRSGRGDQAQDRRHGGAPRPGRQGADAIWHGRLRHRARQRGRGEARAGADHADAAQAAEGLRQFRAVAVGHASWSASSNCRNIRFRTGACVRILSEHLSNFASGSRNMKRPGSTCCCCR